MTSNTWNTPFCALLLVAATLMACTEDSPDTESDVACGAGDAITVTSDTFCVYDQNVVVEEGFRCPEGFPHQHDYNDIAICSDFEQPPGDDELMDIYTEWGERHNTPDGNNSNGGGSNGETSLSALCDTMCVEFERCGEGEPNAPLVQCSTWCTDTFADDCGGDDDYCIDSPPEDVLPCMTAALADSCDGSAFSACAFIIPEGAIQACLDDNPGEACSEQDPSNCVNVIDACNQSGANLACDPLISSDAAICIALAAGFEPGLELVNGLVFNVNYGRPIWATSNLRREGDDGSREGDTIDIDAVTGRVLGRGSWASMP